jgi:hypothetical protein
LKYPINLSNFVLFIFLRIIGVVKAWLDYFPEVFASSEKLSDLIEEFIRIVRESSDIYADQLLDSLARSKVKITIIEIILENIFFNQPDFLHRNVNLEI